MTEAGKGTLPGSRFTTSAGLMPRVMRNMAMSPTTLLLGVTLTMSPKSCVDLGIDAGDFVPALRQAHAGGLLLEVGVLAAGHLVQIDLRRAAARGGVERRVTGRHVFPVFGKLVERVQIQTGVAPGVCATRPRWN